MGKRDERPQSFDARSPDGDNDGEGLQIGRGPLGSRSRGVLPPQEVFKNIVFDNDSKDINLRNSSPNR